VRLDGDVATALAALPHDGVQSLSVKNTAFLERMHSRANACWSECMLDIAATLPQDGVRGGENQVIATLNPQPSTLNPQPSTLPKDGVSASVPILVLRDSMSRRKSFSRYSISRVSGSEESHSRDIQYLEYQGQKKVISRDMTLPCVQ
jgi:hypothetical protein